MQQRRIAYPFPHICIDNFLTEQFAQKLHTDFPSQEDASYQEFCKEDGGKIGTNYANNQPSSFTPAFQELDAVIKSPSFLTFLQELTGIDHLEYDADYFGGGIRESRNNTFLPVHLDFNYHPKTLSHRRLNLLLYLNQDWDQQWGDNIQVHLDPNKFKDNSLVASYPPMFNRCFIFETSETSWHGFDQLQLPPDHSPSVSLSS